MACVVSLGPIFDWQLGQTWHSPVARQGAMPHRVSPGKDGNSAWDTWKDRLSQHEGLQLSLSLHFFSAPPAALTWSGCANSASLISFPFPSAFIFPCTRLFWHLFLYSNILPFVSFYYLGRPSEATWWLLNCRENAVPLFIMRMSPNWAQSFWKLFYFID